MSMTWKRAAVSAFLGVLVAAGCDDDDDENLTDREIVGVLIAANEGEVEVSQLGLDESTDPEVMAFAQRMIAEHGAALERTQAIADQARLPADESDESAELKAQVAALRSRLDVAAAGREYDLVFMCGQARLHRIVLETIDDRLEPDAEDAAVRGEVDATRPMIASHLDMARAIVERQAAAGGERGEVDAICADRGGS